MQAFVSHASDGEDDDHSGDNLCYVLVASAHHYTSGRCSSRNMVIQIHTGMK